MDGTRRRRLATGLGIAGLAIALLVAGGCSGGAEDSAGSAAPADANDQGGPGAAAPGAGEKAAPPAAGAAPGQPGAAAPGQPGAAPDLRVDQRSIIYRGSMNVRVDDVDAAAGRAASIATAAGGFVGADNRSSTADGAEASLQLRVPAERFAGVVEQLAGLGTPERREISTQDVTEEVVDLDARISTQRARVESGRRLLAQAKTLGELVTLEGELAKREADLASLEAKKRRLADLTALSTVTVVLLRHEAKIVEEKRQDEPVGFLAGLDGGWRALVATVRVLSAVLGALLPWLVAFGVPALVVVWLLRRRRRTSRPTEPGAPVVAPVQATPGQAVPGQAPPGETAPGRATATAPEIAAPRVPPPGS
ncbi:DUF4349 domain-containing protein [Micromonospora sp. NPDC049559]|uniref:DUF4349 domain-containing protein n=1 Tax=Micromonospora sp. NPDC049559 TaxID=3155923 RepID=UPI00342799E4